MSLVDIVPAKLTHVGPIASRMRAVDRLEAFALGFTPKQALRRSLSASTICLTAVVNGRAEAMFGLVPTSLLCGEGSPWLLGTDEVYRHGRTMLRIGAKLLAEMRALCPHLTNVVAAENGRAIRLLERWGFTIDDDHHDHRGIPMRRFLSESRGEQSDVDDVNHPSI